MYLYTHRQLPHNSYIADVHVARERSAFLWKNKCLWIKLRCTHPSDLYNTV